MTVNERLFTLLDSTKISQKEFADTSGIPTSTLSAWKKRNTDIPASYLSTIADFFNVSLEYLINGEEKQIQADISSEESELVSTYKKLDSRGRYKVQTTAYEELDRIEKATEIFLKNKQDIVS